MAFPNPRQTPGSVMPVGGIVGDPLLFDDFILSSVDAAADADAGWFATSITGTFLIADDHRNGVLRIDGGGTTNQGAYIVANGSSFQLAADKDIYFECRYKVIEPAACDVFVGLGTVNTTPLDVIEDAIGFGTYDGSDDLLDGGTGDIYTITKNGSSATAWSLSSTLADSGRNLNTEFETLAFHVIGNKRVKFFINGAEKANVTTNLPDGFMTVHMAMLENSGSDPELLIDYIYCAQTR